jgi:L-2-hydroxyglutarate oxidase LhgO
MAAVRRQTLASLITLTSSSRRNFSQSTPRATDFTHTVIGAGVVGLAISARLAAREGGNTLLLERRESFGHETSSRGSEVIESLFQVQPFDIIIIRIEVEENTSSC